MSIWDHVGHSRHGGSKRAAVRRGHRADGCPRSFGLTVTSVGELLYIWSFRRPSLYPIGLAVVPHSAVRDRTVPHILTWEVWKMLKKSQFAAQEVKEGNVPTRDPLSQNHANLWDFMTQSAWEDGTDRETGSMLIFCDAGALKAMLKDRDSGMCLWITAPALGSLLDVADAKLVDPAAEWKKDRGAAANVVKKKR
jgi:hypothetical protein